MKKLILFLALLALLPSALRAYNFSAENDDGVTIYYYTLNTETPQVCVSGTSGKNNDFIVIPSSVAHDGIEYTVTLIGSQIFHDYQKLISITLPNTITTIGDNAFLRCKSLTSITIPNSVTSVGFNAFKGCTSLTSVTLSNTLTRIERSTFEDCTSLTSITLPDSITEIHERAFYNCQNLTSITIPENVTRIGQKRGSEYCDVFYGSGLKTVYFNAINCPDFSFEDKSPFDQLKLESVVFGDKVQHIPADICSHLALTSITIPESVTSIGSGAFHGCGRLTAITIPESVISIGGSAFSYCHGLTSITIPESVTSIEPRTFI